jgi:CheY-like chemotaxis protein
MRHVFEPFFTTKEVGQGTGLGLASVYGAVKQHNGWIEVRSEVGRGTSFDLYFPVVEPLPGTRTAALASAAQAATLRGHETVLVVEDEPALRRLVVEILEWHGYRVFSAESGLLALEVWREERENIDLLVTDMVMPGMMGPELAERLQQESPKLRVIYTSGYSPGIAGKDLALLESSNFLPKPYPPSKLLQLVRECLDARGPEARAVPAITGQRSSNPPTVSGKP